LDNRTSYDSNAPNNYVARNEYWLNVHQPLFNAGRELVGLTNSGELRDLRKYQLKQYRDLLILTVADTFYRMLEQQNELDALTTLETYTQNHYEMVKAQEEAQVAQRKDTLLAEATLYDIQARIVQTRNLFNTTRLSLQLLVGVPLAQKLTDVEQVTEVPQDSAAAITIALTNNQDIKIAEQQIKLAQANVDLAKAGYLPSVNLDWNRYLHMESSSYDGLDWNLVLSASLPIDNGGKYGKLQENYSQLRQANIEKERLLKTLRNDVETAYRNWQAAQANIDARQKGLDAAQESADIVEEQYKVGDATNVEVLFTKNAYDQSRIALDTAKTDLKLSYLRLKFVMGLLAKEF
jgi:outer membrane protein